MLPNTILKPIRNQPPTQPKYKEGGKKKKRLIQPHFLSKQSKKDAV